MRPVPAARQSVQRPLPVLTAITLAVTAAALVAPTGPPPAAAQEEEGVTPARVSGGNRYETAAAVAELTFDEADDAVVATGEDFPDALAASYAAGSIDGPILLAEHDRIPGITLEALDRLGVERVVLVGGGEALGEEVETQLTRAGYGIERLAGADRFETAVEVATRYGTDGEIGVVDGDRAAILASGASFADALSAGPLAAAARLPLFLTPRATPDDSVSQALDELGIERVIVVGGEAAVGEEVVAAYEQDYEVERMGGATRTGTAATVAENLVERFGLFSRETVLLARGDDFPDALTASIHGAVLGAPILLSATPTVLSQDTAGWLRDTCPEVEVLRALGGGAALSEQALAAAVEAAEACLTGPEVVSTLTTPLVPGQDRNVNIHLAADYIDGDVIPPGGMFSLDAAIGPRTRERGFVEDGFIDDDGNVISVVGGGVSQMATTFVNAAWFAGVEILEHRPHTIYFERYPMCREATLVAGTLDVLVRNDSPHDITVSTSYTDSSVTVSFVSRPWAEVASWTSDPFAVEGPGGAFSVNCGRTITYPDGTTADESYSWRYDSGYPG